MNAYPNDRARVTDECLQIHHKPCDVFENSMNQCQMIEEGLITNEKVSSTTTQNKSGTNNTLVMLNDIRMLKNKLRGDLNEQQRIIHQHLS